MTKGQSVVAVKDLEFSYGSFSAVKGISFEVGEGEIFALLGTDGVEKIITLEMI